MRCSHNRDIRFFIIRLLCPHVESGKSKCPRLHIEVRAAEATAVSKPRMMQNVKRSLLPHSVSDLMIAQLLQIIHNAITELVNRSLRPTCSRIRWLKTSTSCHSILGSDGCATGCLARELMLQTVVAYSSHDTRSHICLACLCNKRMQ